MISDDGGETWNYKVFYNNYFLAHRSVRPSRFHPSIDEEKEIDQECLL